jgi:diacylglycerol kinase family enzyme
VPPQPGVRTIEGMRCLVLLNGAAGSGAAEGLAGEVRVALAEAGVEGEVRITSGAGCAGLARAARDDPGIDAVVAAGGDGTVSAVAGALAGSPKPLGILPLGTLNHFAKDLGIPLDLAAAAAVLARGVVRRVDVGEVNGRVFVNNSQLGLYPQAVRAREGLAGRLGKWLAMVAASALALLRFRRISLRIGLGGEPAGALPRRTAFVFVGNNRYDTALLAAQRREALDRGELGVFVTRARTRGGILLLALRALVGRADRGRDLEALAVPRLSIAARRGALQVAADGELLRLRPPLEYAVRPGALRVLAPGPAA